MLRQLAPKASQTTSSFTLRTFQQPIQMLVVWQPQHRDAVYYLHGKTRNVQFRRVRVDRQGPKKDKRCHRV